MLTAVENVSLPLIFRNENKEKREKLASEMLVKVGLKGYEKENQVKCREVSNRGLG